MKQRMHALMVAAFLGVSAAVMAVEQNPPLTEPERVYVLGSVAHKKLALARQHAEKKDFKTALRATELVRESRRSTDYERAMAWSINAYCHYELKQYDEAVAAYRRVLAQNDIPGTLRDSTQYQIAQLYMATEDWAQAATSLESWIATQTEPNIGAYTLLGQAYYQVKDFERALPAFEKAIEAAKVKGSKAKENVYLLLRAIHYHDKNYAKLLDVLKLLVMDYPKKDYWLQLAAVYGELDQPRKQLAATEYAYLQGLLTQSGEYITLAQLFMANEVPLRAAGVMEAGFEKQIVATTPGNFRLLADAYVLAKDYPRAIAALERANQNDSDAETHLRLAQLYMETAQWEKVVESSQTAIRAGNLKRPDIASIVSGLALYELNRLDEAFRAFDLAARDERSRATAQQWQGHISREQQRLASLKSMQQG